MVGCCMDHVRHKKVLQSSKFISEGPLLQVVRMTTIYNTHVTLCACSSYSS